MPAEPPGEARAIDGRVPGRRGRATRRRLLDETAGLLAETSYRDVTVREISRRAGTSSATFYQYFADVEAAVLVLAGEMADEGSRRLRRLVEDPRWDSVSAAEGLVGGFMRFYDEHRALLGVIDLAAREGDDRFGALRHRALGGMFDALCDLVAEARREAGPSPDLQPPAVAAVLMSMLTNVAAHRPGFESWGLGGDQLEAAMASIIDASVRALDPRS
ncbi:MAG: TetR family transcriptional regulator [Acidimicrobiales bacterium]